MAQYIKKLQSGGLFKANGKNYNYQDVYNEVQSQIKGQKIDKNLELGLNYLLSTGKLGNYGNNEAYSIVRNALLSLSPIENENQKLNSSINSDKKQSEQKDNKIQKFSNSKSLNHYIIDKLFGGQEDISSVMNSYLSQEAEGENGYDNKKRKEHLLNVINNYLADLDKKQYDFSSTDYQTQDNYRKIISDFADMIRNGESLENINIYAIQNKLGQFATFLDPYENVVKQRRIASDPINQARARGESDSQINQRRWEEKLNQLNKNIGEMQTFELKNPQRDVNGNIVFNVQDSESGDIDSAVLNIISNNGDLNSIISNPNKYDPSAIFGVINEMFQQDEKNKTLNPIEQKPQMFSKFDDYGNFLINSSVNLDNGTAIIYNPQELKLFRIHLSKFPKLQEIFKDEWLNKNPLTSLRKGGIFKAQIGIDSMVVANARKRALKRLQQDNDTTAKGDSTEVDNDLASRVEKSKETMSKSDYARFASAVTTLIAAIDPNPVRSLVEGTLATGTDFIVDAFDKDVSSEETWQRLASNLGLTAASMIPGYMAARWSKLGKEISTVKRYLPYIIGGSMSGGFAAYGGQQISDALDKVLEGKAEKEDWRNLIYGLSSLIGGSRGVKHNISSGSSKVFGNKKEYAITKNGLYPVTHEQYQNLGKRGNDWKSVIGTEDNMEFQIPDNSNTLLGKTANWISDRAGISRYPRTSKYKPSLENLYTYDEGKRKVVFTGDKRIAQGLYIDDRKSLGQLGKNIYNNQVHEKVGNLINKFKQTGNITFDEYKYLKSIYDSNHDYEANLLDILTTLNGNKLDPSKVNNIFIQHNGNNSKISRIYTKNQTGEIVIDPQSTEGLTPLDLTYNMNRQKFREYIDSKKPKYSFFKEDEPNIRYDDIEGYNLALDMVEPARDNIVQIEQETGTQAPKPVETAIDTNTETSPQIKKQQETKYKNNKRKKKKHNNGGEINYSDKLLQLSALRNGGIVKAQNGLDTRFLDEYSKLEYIPDWYKNIYRQDHLIDWKENLDKSKSGTLETYPLHHLKADLKSAYILNNAYTSNKDAVGQDIQNYYTKRYNNRSLQDFVDAYNKDAETIRNSFSRNNLTYKENNDWSAHNQLFWDMFANRSTHNAQNLYDLGLDQKSKNILGSTTWHRRMDRYSKKYKDLTDEEKKSRIHRVNTGNNGEYGYVYKEDNGNIYIPQDDELKKLGFELFSATRPVQTTEQENRPITSTEPVENQNRQRVTGETLEQSQENTDQANGDNNEQNGGYVIGSGFDILNRNKGKFSNWFQFVPKAAEAALLWSSNASNNKRANIAKQKKPGIVNPLTIFRNTYRNLYGEQAAQQQANNMMSSVGQRQTSDSSLNIASRLDAQRIVNDAVTNAKNASNQVFNQTAEFQRQADLQTLQSHLDAQNRNSAALTENNNYKIDVEAARLAANQENIKNILTGWIYEQKAKAEELQALRRNLGERFIDYRMQQELSNDPAYQQALLKYQEAYQADAENSTEETIRELKNASTLLQAAINNSKARAIQNKINRLGRLYTPPYFGRNYEILDDIKNLRKGGRMYGSKIDDSDVKKRTKDHDRLAKQVIASLREFNKATDRLSKGQFLSIKKMLS